MFIDSDLLKSFFWFRRRSQKITFLVNPNPFISVSPYWDCERDCASFPIRAVGNVCAPVCMCCDSHQHSWCFSTLCWEQSPRSWR